MERIAVVTGASRGAGKGIALALGAAGATVYVTGRSIAAGDSRYGGTVAETAQLITDAGGLGIAVAVDHADALRNPPSFFLGKAKYHARFLDDD
jgi:NAD(P)-dependent dehydrogenase (short-subunit alcohol dehydrogenase family)